MFRIDLLALIAVFGLLVAFWAFASRKNEPRLFYPTLDPVKTRIKTWREKWARVPFIFFSTAMGLLLVALIDPHQLLEDASAGPPREGMAIYLALDRSSTMGAVIDHVYEKGEWQAVTRFDQLKNVASQFIEKIPTDLVGVVAFARSTQVISPLTIDHKAVLEAIANLSIIKDKAQDGTAIGYAIYKTAHLIAATKAFQEKLSENELPPYLIHSAVLVVITDGLQDPSALDRGNPLRTMELEEASAFAKEKGVRTYIVNIEPRMQEEQFAPNRHQMERITQETGGKLILADNISSTLEHIHQLEKSRIYSKDAVLKRISFFPFLIGMSLLLLGVGVVCEETLWRKTV